MSFKIDQASDFSHKELYTFLKGTDLPDFVKNAELDDFSTLSGLPKTAFADVQGRKFPINTPARVYTSNAYFQNKKAALQDMWGEKYVNTVEANIKTAAEVFGILDSVEQYSQNTIQKQAADYSEEYLFTTNIGDMELNLFSVKTAEHVKHAADLFAKDINNLPFEWRSDIAKSILKKSTEMGVTDLPETVLKYAGQYYPDLSKVSEEIWRRSTKLKNEENRTAYEKIAADVANVSSIEEIFKIAETCYYIEKMEGLYENVKVAQVLGDPVDMFFTLPVEKIAEMLEYVEMGGGKYKLSDLEKVSSEAYEQAFGFSIDPTKKAELMEVLPTIPRSDVKLFEQLTGVRPI